MNGRYRALLPLLGMVAGNAVTADSLPYPIVDTGQAVFFDDTAAIESPAAGEPFYGQDAHYTGNAPAYRDNGDGTISDLVTGLIWERGVRSVTWANAAGAAAQADTGGFTDWRVPTVKELYSLMLFTGNQGSGRPDASEPPADAEPFYDTNIFEFTYPDSGRYIDVQFVTGTEYVARVMGGQACFFGVNFADGRIKCYPLSGRRGERDYYARFVRGNPLYGRNDLRDNGDGTVTDRATGLMWARLDSGDPAFAEAVRNTRRKDGAMNWEEALAFAERLEFAGFSDWRLPDAKELHSIVDYTRAPDTDDSAAIDPVFAATRIDNEAGAADYPFCWASTTFRPGRDAVVIGFGRALGYFRPPGKPLAYYDVHGAGSQRTDAKSGTHHQRGPQGDVRRVYNFVRVVRLHPQRDLLSRDEMAE